MVKFENVSLSYGNTVVFDSFSQQFAQSKINCIIGPSGCGKTTMLNVIAKLKETDNGKTTLPQTVSYVFQDDLLIPQLTARKNIEFVLRQVYETQDQINNVTDKFFAIADLAGIENKYPHQLSGGMRQRLSIIRAFAYPSEVLLLDEPFKALDYSLKQQLMQAFIDLYEINRKTVIYVTHDIDEALLTADNICIYSNKPMTLQACIKIEDSRPRKLYSESLTNVKNLIYKQIEKW